MNELHLDQVLRQQQAMVQMIQTFVMGTTQELYIKKADEYIQNVELAKLAEESKQRAIILAMVMFGQAQVKQALGIK